MGAKQTETKEEYIIIPREVSSVTSRAAKKAGERGVSRATHSNHPTEPEPTEFRFGSGERKTESTPPGKRFIS